MTAEKSEGIVRNIVVMGVCGCGKTTVGRALAVRLEGRFADADAFHPPENIDKMRAGIPLTDADRADWLDALNRWLRAADRNPAESGPGILACSALRESYRRTLFEGLTHPRALVYLKGTYDEIEPRMRNRSGHYMPPELLQSQFETLEEPADAITIPATLSVETIVERCCEALSAAG